MDYLADCILILTVYFPFPLFILFVHTFSLCLPSLPLLGIDTYALTQVVQEYERAVIFRLGKSRSFARSPPLHRVPILFGKS